MTSRAAIAFFYDPKGIVDDYMTYLLKEMRPFVDKMILVSNGPLNKDGEIALRPHVDRIVIRDNIGFDVGAYRAGLEALGFEELEQFDEVILFNHTFFGPIFPFSEMFDAMDKRSSDFWGITAHKAMEHSPFVPGTALPYHIQSHFIAIRKRLAASAAFRRYWDTMPTIGSYVDSIVQHESRFTKHFEDLGYSHSTYIDADKYGSYYPAFIDVDETIRDRCPILKRRIFFHDPMYHEENGIDLPRALDLIKTTSDYDLNLIWRNIVRSSELRNLNTAACLTSVLPDVRLKPGSEPKKYGKIAVCVHVYYTEMLDEIFDLTKNIPVEYDFIATTDSEKKKQEIEAYAAGKPGVGKVIVIVMDENRGRDMAALFISCRDIFLTDEYGLVCRLHTKKSPQVMLSRSNVFKRHMFENLLNSEGYVTNVLDMFEDNPWIGLAIPPIVNISYWTLGHAWFGNDIKVNEMVKFLDLDVALDPNTPVAPYGTMFWFRPKALRKLFQHEWKFSEFNAEPNHIDGGLAHALERVIAYVAQDARYTTQHIINSNLAAWNYTMLELKLDRLMSKLPLAQLGYQDSLLRDWKTRGYILSAPPPPKTMLRAVGRVLYKLERVVHRSLRALLTTGSR